MFAVALIHAAPAQDETIVDDIAEGEGAFVVSPNDDKNFILKLLKLKKLLLFG